MHAAVRNLSRCVPIQGLHPSKDSSFVIFEGESFRETLLTVSTVVKWSSVVFGAFPGCITRCFTLTSRFLLPSPVKVRIYVTRRRHFLSIFFDCAKNLGICEAMKDSSRASSKNREIKGHICGLHSEEPSCSIVTYLPFKYSSEGCRP